MTDSGTTGFWTAFSTSSPMASVAFFSPDWQVLWAASELAPRAATGACARLLTRGLAEAQLDLKDGLGFGADLGPGSFTGVRVGVMLAKTLAFAHGTQAFGVPAFDLISAGTASVASRKNEWFVRRPGEEPVRSTVWEGIGYPSEDPVYPLAERFALLANRGELVAPEALLPLYFAEPSISVPKRAYGSGLSNPEASSGSGV